MKFSRESGENQRESETEIIRFTKMKKFIFVGEQGVDGGESRAGFDVDLLASLHVNAGFRLL
jgi:hypothetical protein